jgi:hypothetical protein
MTLSIGAITRNELWLIADRRISYADKAPWDDAAKLFQLTATDGSMLVSYAGLGVTVGGMEPSEWLRNSLRNLKMTVEQARWFIADLVQREFAPQMKTIAWASPGHCFQLLCSVGGKTSAYYIGLLLDGKTGEVRMEKKVALVDLHRPRGPKTCIQVFGTKLSKWEFREVQRAISERASGRLSPSATAKALAAVNFGVASRLSTKTVGERCIVTFKDGQGGGQSWFFTGTTQDKKSPGFPLVVAGIDMQALLAGIMEEYAMRQTRNEAAMSEASAQKDFAKVHELLGDNMGHFLEMLTANAKAMPKKNDTSLK